MKIKLHLICVLIACLSFGSCVKNGSDGKNTLIKQIPEPPGAYCAEGGVKIITGIDENRNNVLDSNEIQQTEFVCNGNYDKETIIYMSTDVGHYTTSAQGTIPYPLGLDNFNITNYLADSIAFNTYMYTQDERVKAYAELYDVTNNKAISNTLLTTNSITYELKSTTVNFINQLPKSPIKLGLRIRAERDGVMIVISNPVIKLYKK